MNHIDFSNKNVLKLILQFLLENGLLKSYFTLSNESGVSLNWVENVNKIKTIISKGLWNELIEILKYIKIPAKLQAILFEHIVLELLELKEPLVAQYLMENNKSLFLSHHQFNEKYNNLLEIIEESKNIILNKEIASFESNYSLISKFVKNNYIEGGNKEKSREIISKLISENLVETRSSMLLEVIGDSLKYKNSLKLNPEEVCESFRSELNENSLIYGYEQLKSNKLKELKYFVKSSITIDTEKYGYLCLITFSPSGEQIFATSKGYIIVGDIYFNNSRSRNLDPKRIYSHCEKEVKILGLSVADINNQINYEKGLEPYKKSERILIASTSERADIKIWDYSNSSFIFFVNAYEKYITDLTFNKDATCILSSSIEGIIKIHGLKSERVIKYFPKNSEFFINKVSYNNSETMVISAISDGSINIWDIKSSSCIATYDICSSQILELKPINNFDSLFPIQKSKSSNINIQKFDSFFVGSKSGMYIVNVNNGEVTDLSFEEHFKKYLFSVTFNSKMNVIICLLKNFKVVLCGIQDQNMNYKEIELENLHEYEQIFTDQLNGNIVVSGKNQLIILSDNYQISNQVDTDSNTKLISSDSKL